MLTPISTYKSFSGEVGIYEHFSESCHCTMRFALYLPQQASKSDKVPVVYWLSGLTCNEANFMQKAGAQRIASELGIAIVTPDTSPRGDDVADDPEGQYDMGLGAGFYINATQAPWQAHYQMYDYIIQELPQFIKEHFPVNTDRQGIAGHSMGGHGALICGLREPHLYQSISAFSPICNPSKVPWGQKVFSHYLGRDPSAWAGYDATELIKQSKKTVPIRIDMGDKDEFWSQQLTPERILAAAEENHTLIDYYSHVGYDHSYYFIASFIEAQLRFHVQYLF